MHAIDFLRIGDRVVRLLFVAHALVVFVLTALWTAERKNWIGLQHLTAVFGPSAGWDIPLWGVITFFALLALTAVTLIILMVLGVLSLVGVQSGGLRGWAYVLAFQLFALVFFAFAPF